MSGMNSGLDTEGIVNALSAASKLKITKQERNLLKYQATQEAYRDVISKFTNIKSKYFDILKKESNLSGSTMWNKFAAKTSVNGAETVLAGVTIATSVNSSASNYNVKVNKTASQAKISGSSLSNNAKLDTDSLVEGEEYGITVTVGSETKNITFTGGATAEETINTLNDKLREAFGDSNVSANGGSNKGMVYLDDSGKFTSREGKGISISGVGTMTSSNTLSFDGIASGTNTLTFQVGGETLNVSFQTLAEDYFSDIFDDEGNIKKDADKTKVELYNQIKDDYVESKKYAEYEEWAANATEDEKAALLDKAFAKASEEHRSQYLDKYLAGKYDTYRAEAGDEALGFNEWKEANYVEGDMDNELYADFHDYYYDKTELSAEQIAARDERIAVLTQDHNDAMRSEYDSIYLKKCEEDGTEPLSYEDWYAAEGLDEKLQEEIQKINDSYKPEQGYELDKDLWTGATYNEYDSFKEFEGTVKEEDVVITEEAIINHYNETSLNNSIGALETKDGIKFDVEFDGENATITAKNANGELQNVSVTSATGSANNFGTSVATTSISQISNSTKLSDLGIAADENGNYSFTVNGVDFKFEASTTVKDMMKAVNASDAGVKMTYSSLNNAFSVTALEYGTDSKIEFTNDSQGLLSGIGLMAGSSYTAGNNLEVEINGSVYESSNNSIEADGTTFTFTEAAQGKDFDVEISKDTSALVDTIKGFVEDYNKLIEDVYKYLDEEPDDDYYFLADADKEDLELSEKQEEKWEEKAKLGLLYHDNTITSVLSKLRTSLMGSITTPDGEKLSLASIGIKTSKDYNEHGKLTIDEEALTAAIEADSDSIARLFSDDKSGVMTQFEKALNDAVSTTGDKGTLINKAGLASGSSATDNEIYAAMKKVQERIKTLTQRYENEQDRLWRRYSSMETMLSKLNSQQASISSYFAY